MTDHPAALHDDLRNVMALIQQSHAIDARSHEVLVARIKAFEFLDKHAPEIARRVGGEDFVLVPREPTDDMLDAGENNEVGGYCYSCSKAWASADDCRRVYAAMINAAPPAPSEVPHD